jgi:hypothetical protein
MPLKSDPTPFTDDQSEAEKGMRRALGLDRVAPSQNRPSQHPVDRQKRRFVQDGEVPVVIAHGRRDHGMHSGDPLLTTGSSPSNRIVIAEAAVKAEREARERAERSLAEAEAIIRDLRTKLGHATLALDEMRDTARRAKDEKQAAEAALAVERDARDTAEKVLQQATAKRRAVEDRIGETARAGQSTVIAAKAGKIAREQAGAKSMAKASPRLKTKEPKPVRWWIKAGKRPA